MKCLSLFSGENISKCCLLEFFPACCALFSVLQLGFEMGSFITTISIILLFTSIFKGIHSLTHGTFKGTGYTCTW